MKGFKKDLTTLIEEGIIAPNKETIRFVFRNNNIFKQEIGYLELSTRAYNSLRRANITTVEKIGDNWDNLNNLRGMGATSVKEIKNKYLAFYYSSLDTEEKRNEFWADTITATINLN